MLGELHPVWVQRHDLGSAPVAFEIELDDALAARFPAYVEISRMPAVVRDLALVVAQDIAVARVLEVLWGAAAAVVRDIALFDVYQGPGIDPDRKSLAFRVSMQDTQRTLEEAEVEAAIAALVGAAESALGARLRGSGE
jgi:phenylalanyl-tRNA synthetase beta chain